MRRVAIALLIATSACAGEPSGATSRGEVVARVGDQEITVADVAAEARRTSQSPAAALEDLIRLELVVVEARRRMIPEQEAVIQEARKSAMVQRYLESEVEPSLTVDSIPDEVTRPLYEKNRRSFSHGRLVEVAMVAILTGENMKKEPRAQREAVMRELASQARSRTSSEEQYRSLAEDPAWKSRGIRFMRLTLDRDFPYCSELGEAAQALKKPGDATGLVVCPDGAFMATYVGEKPPEHMSYESVRPRFRQVVWESWRKRRFDELSLDLARQHQAFEERERVEVPPPPGRQ